MSILLPTRRPLLGSPFNAFDRDAQTYIRAVEAADGQPLEAVTRSAINQFIVECKQDGIWDAIKASCILAGARTLAGCLVPLKGTAPTNFNFVAGDYNRKTGLKGNGSTKYLDSNRSAIQDPINNRHFSVYQAETGVLLDRVLLGYYRASPSFLAYMAVSSSGWRWSCNTTNQTPLAGAPAVSTGFAGVNKVASGTVSARFNSVNYSAALGNADLQDVSAFAFARNNSGIADAISNARLAFYSIGESLNLALLDARVTTLINAFSALP